MLLAARAAADETLALLQALRLPQGMRVAARSMPRGMRDGTTLARGQHAGR
jgi:hypothetical protein